MPRYEITSPDGKRWEVSAPDGATQEQVLQYAQTQWAGSQPAPKPAALSTADRIGTGLADPIHGGAQLLTKMLPSGLVEAGNRLNNYLADKTGLVARLPAGGVDEQVKKREADYQAQRAAAGETGMDWARLAGNVASPVNLGIGSLAAPAAGLSLLGRTGAAAAGGAAGAALAPVTTGEEFASEKLKQMGIGAGFGGALAPIAAGVGRIVSPKASTNPDLALLRDAGVKPTLGQSLGGRWSAVEEKLQSLPITGDMITNARKSALEQFNAAAINRAAGKVGAQVDEVGHTGVAKAGDAIGQAYDDVLSGLKTVKFDQTFQQDLLQLRRLSRGLTDPMRAKFNETLKDVVQGRTSAAPGMTAETFKKVESELGQNAARYGRSSVASEQELGDALKQLQALMRDQVARTSPDAAQKLKEANAAYANLVRVEGAAKAAKNSDGVFTPAQLNAAIQQADNSVRKRAVARGNALMQDLGTAGQNVLGNKVPNSGTFDRAALGIGGLGAGLVNPMIPAALIGGAGLYSSPVQSLLRSLVASRPALAEPVAGLLNRSAPVLGTTGGLLSIEVVK
jgi:hypothetical protein